MNWRMGARMQITSSIHCYLALLVVATNARDAMPEGRRASP